MSFFFRKKYEEITFYTLMNLWTVYDMIERRGGVRTASVLEKLNDCLKIWKGNVTLQSIKVQIFIPGYTLSLYGCGDGMKEESWRKSSYKSTHVDGTYPEQDDCVTLYHLVNTSYFSDACESRVGFEYIPCTFTAQYDLVYAYLYNMQRRSDRQTSSR